MRLSETAGFSDPDRSDPAELIRNLAQFEDDPQSLALRRLTYLAMGLKPGMCVVDVGCGTGFDTANLARAVGPSGRVLGLDVSSAMIETALRRVENLPASFVLGRAEAAPLSDSAFDGARAAKLLYYVEDPAAVIGEMLRITKPGGRIVLCESDSESRVIDLREAELVRRVLGGRHTHTRHAGLGLRLRRLMLEAGAINVTARPFTTTVSGAPPAGEVALFLAYGAEAFLAGELSTEEEQQWRSAVEAASVDGKWFSAVTGYVVSGEVPG